MPDWVERYYQSKRAEQDSKGGPGSGHHGHAGRPGKVGGSVPGKGGSVSGAGEGLSYTAPAAVLQNAERDADEAIAELAGLDGMTIEETERKIFSRLEKDLENPVAIFRSTDATISILAGGRFKTQFETGRSAGMFSPEGRAEAEQNGLGYPPDVDPKERPVYGVVNTARHDGRQYGDVEIVLRDSVKQRSTITLGDSLTAFADGYLAGTPYLDPGKASVDHRALVYGRGYSVGYIEVQIQGGVTVGDIAKIRLHRKSSMRGQDAATVSQWAARAGIEVEYVD